MHGVLVQNTAETASKVFHMSVLVFSWVGHVSQGVVPLSVTINLNATEGQIWIMPSKWAVTPWHL